MTMKKADTTYSQIPTSTGPPALPGRQPFVSLSSCPLNSCSFPSVTILNFYPSLQSSPHQINTQYQQIYLLKKSCHHQTRTCTYSLPILKLTISLPTLP